MINLIFLLVNIFSKKKTVTSEDVLKTVTALRADVNTIGAIAENNADKIVKFSDNRLTKQEV